MIFDFFSAHFITRWDWRNWRVGNCPPPPSWWLQKRAGFLDEAIMLAVALSDPLGAAKTWTKFSGSLGDSLVVVGVVILVYFTVFRVLVGMVDEWDGGAVVFPPGLGCTHAFSGCAVVLCCRTLCVAALETAEGMVVGEELRGVVDHDAPVVLQRWPVGQWMVQLYDVEGTNGQWVDGVGRQNIFESASGQRHGKTK